MLWIGLTGGLASGKSTVSKIFERSGVPVIDADKLAHLALSPGQEPFQQVLAHFSKDLLLPDGTLDRKKLGSLVFQKPEELRFLESVIHPFVQRKVIEMRQALKEQGADIAVYDVPLLFEKNLQSQFDRVVVIACSEELQIQRMLSRDGFTREEAILRLAQQKPLTEKATLGTDVIWNEGTLNELELQVQNLIQKFRKSSSKA